MPLALFSLPVLSPLVVLGLSVVFIVVAIGVLRIHAFFALIFAAVFVALVGRTGSAGSGGMAAAVEAVMAEFGSATGRIGFTIAIAAVIGTALLESGAADKIIRCLIAQVGEARAPLALLCGSFLLAIPIFFDTVFFLLVPLARALSLRTGRNYVLYLLAICAGGVITHATVPPTPGPLAAAETLHVDMGAAILVGIALGILPALAGLWFARWINRRMPLPVRATSESSLESLAAVARKDDRELPGFVVSITPVVLPVVLIASASFAASLGAGIPAGLANVVAFLGNKNVALLLGCLVAVAVYLRQKQLRWRDTATLAADPLATAGVIILITAAGGAYGAMLKHSGISDVVTSYAGADGHNRILLAWLLAAALRIAQGSTTVAMITAAGIMASLGGTPGGSTQAIYVFLAIGYGALSLSWMNDSGFWIFSRMSGLTDRETLRSWTPLIALISLIGLVEILVLSRLFPTVPFLS